MIFFIPEILVVLQCKLYPFRSIYRRNLHINVIIKNKRQQRQKIAWGAFQNLDNLIFLAQNNIYCLNVFPTLIWNLER